MGWLLFSLFYTYFRVKYLMKNMFVTNLWLKARSLLKKKKDNVRDDMTIFVENPIEFIKKRGAWVA